MKLVLMILLGILALNALVIVFITGILIFDHLRARRRAGKDGVSNDAPANAP